MAEVLELLRADRLLPPRGEGTLYDVGANIGMISTGMLRHGEFRDAVAFEPAPGNFALLQQNVAQNGLTDRVVCMPYALSAEAGTLRLELSEMNFGDHRIRKDDTDGAFGEAARATVDVEVRTLDECLASDARLAGRRPALVWMDIQGHEGFFFRGARDVLTAARVPVVSEFWPYGVARSGMGADEYCAIVRELFTHFYRRVDGRWQRGPIEGIDALYRRMSLPEQYCEVVLVRS
jgi:FkbM family methyltransferase